MMERFKEMMLKLYGSDYEDAIIYCIEEAVDIFGDEPSFNELFIVWGSICKQAEAMKCEG